IGYEKSTVHSLYAPISFFEKYPHIISYLFGDLLLFLFFLRSGTLKKIFTKKPFQFFGDISFMFYLVHMLILFSFSPWLFNALAHHVTRFQDLIITALLSMFVVSLVSYLLYEFVDKP